MAQRIKKNLMLVDFNKLNITNIEYAQTKTKVDTEKYFYLLSEDSKNLYLVRKRFINKLFSNYKLNVATFNVEAKISSKELIIDSSNFIDNVYFIEEDKYFIFSEGKSIVDNYELFISGYFEVSDELVELKEINDSKFISLVDESIKYAYKIQINDDVYIKINTSYLNLKAGAKVKLYGKFRKNDDSYEGFRYLGSNEINFEHQVNSLKRNLLLPVFPYILNIRDFSDINKVDSKFDISGFNIVYEEKEKKAFDDDIKISDVKEEKVVDVVDTHISEVKEKESVEDDQKSFWTFTKIIFIGLAGFAAYIILS